MAISLHFSLSLLCVWKNKETQSRKPQHQLGQESLLQPHPVGVTPLVLFIITKEPNLSCGLRQEKGGEDSFDMLLNMIPALPQTQGSWGNGALRRELWNDFQLCPSERAALQRSCGTLTRKQ